MACRRLLRGRTTRLRHESKTQFRRYFSLNIWWVTYLSQHIGLTGSATHFTLQFPGSTMKGGDLMSNGSMMPFAIASISIATKDRVVEQARSDTPKDLVV